jgi:hypothetical protein
MDGIGFSATKVTVNGEVTTDQVLSSAFEIDFSNFQIDFGDPVEIEIFHKDERLPKVINPQVLKPKSTFKTLSIHVDENEILCWTTDDESGSLTYFVEQFRWNKWVTVGQLEGIGSPGKHEYKYKVAMHTGENKFRVKQKDYTGRRRTSASALFNNQNSSEVTFYPKKVKREIVFSKKTRFEIYDSFGNLVRKGYGDKIECENLTKGIYYMNYGNTNRVFAKG